MDINDFFHFLFFENWNYLWLIAAGVLVLVGLLFLKKALDPDAIKGIKWLNLGYAAFITFYGIAKYVFMGSNYYIERGLDNTTEFEIIYRLGLILSFISMAFLINTIERFLLNTKGWITIIPVIHSILFIFISYEILRTINLIMMPVYLVVVLISYGIVALKGTGAVRSNALLSIIGLLILFLSFFLDTRFFKDLFAGLGMHWFVYVVSPIMAIIGILIFYYSTTPKKEE